MGRIVLRQQRETKNPYVIPGLNKRVYSLEELVYSYFQNLSYLEERIVDVSLCDWLEWEMNRKELAEELRNLMVHDCKIEGFLNKIFSSISYCTKEELEEVKKHLTIWAEQNPLERKKARIDYMMDKGNGREAMVACLELLKETEDNPEMQGILYHNLGVMGARGFYFDMAADFFKKAYEINHREETREMYMLSLRMSLSKTEYVERIGKEGLGEERAVLLEEKILEMLPEEKMSKNRIAFEGLVKDWESGNQGLFQENLRALLGEWKEKWRYS